MNRKKKVFELAGNLDTTMSYAIYGNEDRFKKHKHAWKVWRTLKDFGCKVYPIAEGLDRFEGSKFYSSLESLQGKIDVVIPCLRTEYLGNLVEDTVKSGAKHIWFQEKNWTPLLDEQCKENNIEVVRGCVFKHKIYMKPFAYLHPCYWHGWKENKVPNKYSRF